MLFYRLCQKNKTNNKQTIKQQQKSTKHWHAFERLRIDLIQTEHNDKCCCTLHFDTSLTDIDRDSRSKGWQGSKSFSTNHPTKYSLDLNGIWYTVYTCWCDDPQTHFISSIQ